MTKTIETPRRVSRSKAVLVAGVGAVAAAALLPNQVAAESSDFARPSVAQPLGSAAMEHCGIPGLLSAASDCEPVATTFNTKELLQTYNKLQLHNLQLMVEAQAAQAAASRSQARAKLASNPAQPSPTTSGYLPASDFIRLSYCEASGNWQANTGNGFYGGLQIMKQTWDEAGGLQYAPRPDLATMDQQIDTGRVIQEEEGWPAWPVCSKKVGLP